MSLRPSMVVCLVVAVLLAGCDSDDEERSGTGPSPSPSPVEAGEDLTFPVQDPTNGVMDALVKGTLVRRGECLRIEAPGGGRGVLPIWPYGFGYEEGPESITILDEEGAPVFRTGDEVSMGGGLLGESDTPLPDELASRVGECRGPYWIVGDV